MSESMISYFQLWAFSALLPFALQLSPTVRGFLLWKLVIISLVLVLFASYIYQINFLVNKESTPISSALFSTGAVKVSLDKALSCVPILCVSLGLLELMHRRRQNQ